MRNEANDGDRRNYAFHELDDFAARIVAAREKPAPAERDASLKDQPLSVFSADGQLKRLRDIEKDVLTLAMKTYGQRSEVARKLKIGRSTLYRKLAEHGIEH